MKQSFSAGQKVKLAKSSEPPVWTEFDDDRGRVSKHVKKTIMERFYKGDDKLSCEILHISSDTEREKMRKLGRTKVRIRTSAGETIIIPVEVDKLTKA